MLNFEVGVIQDHVRLSTGRPSKWLQPKQARDYVRLLGFVGVNWELEVAHKDPHCDRNWEPQGLVLITD